MYTKSPVTGRPPTRTEVVLMRFVPSIVTPVPPEGGPYDGSTVLICGANTVSIDRATRKPIDEPPTVGPIDPLHEERWFEEFVVGR